MKKIFSVLALIFLGMLFFGCLDWFGLGGGPEDKIKSELKGEGIDVTIVTMADNLITIEYTQETVENSEEVYANWAFIFGTAVKNAPEGKSAGDLKVAIVCNYEDGTILKVTSNSGNIIAFMDDKIEAWEFLENLKYEYLTEGPLMEDS